MANVKFMIQTQVQVRISIKVKSKIKIQEKIMIKFKSRSRARLGSKPTKFTTLLIKYESELSLSKYWIKTDLI